MPFAAKSLSFTIWSSLRPCLQASRFPFKGVKDSPPLQANCIRLGYPCYLGLNSGRSVSINVNKTRTIFPETFMACACFLNVFQFPIWETLFPVSVFVFKMQIMLTLHVGNFNQNPRMPALAKILRARASEHSSNFCEQFEQRPNFASTFKLDGTIRYPQYGKFLPAAGLPVGS